MIRCDPMEDIRNQRQWETEDRDDDFPDIPSPEDNREKDPDYSYSDEGRSPKAKKQR